MNSTNNDDELRNYVDVIYEVLPSEELFSRAKEYAWQTFFHHSVSTGIIAYQLALSVKANAVGIQKFVFETIEKDLGLTLENFAFLVGIMHDYVKLYSGRERGVSKAQRILGKILEERGLFDPKLQERIISKVILCARAVEGHLVPELEEIYTTITLLVRIADDLMSLSSVDEAVTYLHESRDAEEVTERYGLRFGFVKTSVPSMLQAEVSERIIKLLEEKGWSPLALYADGLILAGDRSSQSVDLREVTAVLRSTLEKGLGFQDRLREIVGRLSRLSLGSIYDLLLQSGESLLEVNEEALNRRSEVERIYHNIIVEYLQGRSLAELEREFIEWKRRAGKPRGSLIDPRRLATGVMGRGSKYFDEILSTIAVSRQTLVDFIKGLGRKEKFLLLAYMVAFASKDVKATIDVLVKALDLSLPKTMDSEFIRLIAIAEAYRSISSGSSNVISKLVERCFDELSSKVMNLDYYIKRFIRTSLKSDIINTERLKSADLLYEATRVSLRNYCRICGIPLDKSTISFDQYGQVIGGGGGASEIWLHDDPPLADLERIATDKGSRIRFICPTCYYEAVKIREGHKPPFLAIALHPVVAYRLWKYLRDRIASIANLYELVRAEATGVAELYRTVLTEKDLKVTEDVLHKLRELEARRAREREIIPIVDDLGARILIPLGGDMAYKKKFVALALALTPIVLSVSGGGQAGVVNTLSGAYNLGSGVAPIILPHQSNIVLSIVRLFERVKQHASRQGRQMTLDEYSIYNQSYITLLETLYVYGLKLFSLYGRMRRARRRDVRVEDYALELHEFLTSTPNIALALDAPPPERLDPREGDEALPYSGLISSKLLEVESRMSQVTRMLEGKEPPSLNKLLYRYAITLRELNENLSRYKVQRPLRRGIEVLLRYASTLGEKDAEGLATDEFLRLVTSVVNTDLESRKKRLRDQHGAEKEVTYASIFFNIFKDIADIVLRLRKELNPTQLRNLIELMLDSTYYKYRYGARAGEGA